VNPLPQYLRTRSPHLATTGSGAGPFLTWIQRRLLPCLPLAAPSSSFRANLEISIAQPALRRWRALSGRARKPQKIPHRNASHVRRLCDFSRCIARLRPMRKKSRKNPGNAVFTTRRSTSQNALDNRIKTPNNQAGTFFNRLKLEKMPLVSL
jgi:hypothetical protein